MDHKNKQEQRKQQFKTNFKGDRKNPNYKKIKEAFLYDETLTFSAANKLFNIIKYTKTGAIKKSSVGSVEKLNKLINNSLKPFKIGQTLSEMNIAVNKKRDISVLIDKKQIDILLANLDAKKKYIMGVSIGNDRKTYMISSDTRGFAKIISQQYYNEHKETDGGDDSYKWVEHKLRLIHNIVFSEINNEADEFIDDEEPRRMQRDGGKYPCYINHKADMRKYQIYNNDKQRVNKTNCLIYALKQCKIEDEKIQQVIIKFSTITESNSDIYLKTFEYIKQKDFKIVSEIIEQNINITVINNREDAIKTNITYGKFEKTIYLAMQRNHIFINEPTIYKRYAILNYEKCIDKKHEWNLYSGKTNIDGNFLSSIELIELLDRNNFLTVIPYSLSNTDKIELITTDNLLSNMNNEQRPFIYEQREEAKLNIFYADLENINNISEISTPFLAGIIDTHSNKPAIYEGEECIKKMLEYIFIKNKNGHKNIVYFHNLKYDFSLMKQYITIKNICEKDNQIYSVDIIYKKINITFRDSYKMFNSALKKFQEAFNLDPKYAKKEFINYDYYDIKTTKVCTANIIKYSCNFSTEDKEGFIEAIKAFRVSDTEFKHIEFYKDYLKSDVELLKHGMQAMNINMVQAFQLSIFNYLTISSYGDAYFKLKGAYDDVYEVCGGLKKWMGKAVYGGRVNCNEKYIKQVINKTINDFDGVSLYPSSISRLCKEAGMPKGMAKRYNKSIDIMKQDYFIIDIQITKINKQQMNPFIAIKNNKGSIKYINTITEPTFVTVDKYTIEDYIEFHGVEFVILDGLYYDEGFNNKFECINDIFKQRLIEKNKKTPAGDIIQVLCKLIMNSAYGKTIMKADNSKNIIVNNKDYKRYIFNNFNTIEYTKILNDEQHLVTIQEADKSYNRAQCGIAILSMSKRIMNEVMDISSTNNLTIYYQDTDSMHMNNEEINELSVKFTEKYNRTLIGKNMGQFHSDFTHKNKECSNVVSVKSIFLGKKAYIDYLEGTDKQGFKHYCTHARMKGINEIALINEASKLENKDMNDNIFEIYEKLADNKAVEFVLNPIEKVSFKFTSKGVSKRETGEFKRTITFKNAEEADEFL